MSYPKLEVMSAHIHYQHENEFVNDKFKGCLLGLALGDAMCAPYEGGLIERLLWRLIGKTNAGELRFTDDTQMSLDIAHSFIKNGSINQQSLAHEFAKSYRWSRGYGPGAGKILKRIKKGMPWHKANVSVYKDGSFGNGAAMRAPVLALCFTESSVEFKQAVIDSAVITHAHSSAVDGALLIAYSTAFALSDMDECALCNRLIDLTKNSVFVSKLELCKQLLELKQEPSTGQVRKLLGNGMTAENSCITAIYTALRFKDKPFIELINFIQKIGGDTDTIAAMSGAIWGAFNGAKRLMNDELPSIEKETQITEVAEQLQRLYTNA